MFLLFYFYRILYTANIWHELETHGTLSIELVDHVFSRFIQQGVIKENILDMMERFGLIAKFSPTPADVKYFVPAQLKSSPEDLCNMEPSPTDPCPLYLHFVHGFVPQGLADCLGMPSLALRDLAHSASYVAPKWSMVRYWKSISNP